MVHSDTWWLWNKINLPFHRYGAFQKPHYNVKSFHVLHSRLWLTCLLPCLACRFFCCLCGCSCLRQVFWHTSSHLYEKIYKKQFMHMTSSSSIWIEFVWAKKVQSVIWKVVQLTSKILTTRSSARSSMQYNSWGNCGLRLEIVYPTIFALSRFVLRDCPTTI